LNFRKDEILEVGIVITTPFPDFLIIEQANWVLPYLVPEQGLPEIVYEMHTKNGLLEECADKFQDVLAKRNQMQHLSKIQTEMMDFVDDHFALDSLLHGSTINFDRAFMEEQFPDLMNLLHYRNFDVSTLIHMVREILPEYVFIKDEKHRAIPDCLESIANGQIALNFLEIPQVMWFHDAEIIPDEFFDGDVDSV